MAVTKTEFIVTADVMGFVKFWKKQPNGIEFVKTFKSHAAGAINLSISFDGMWLCTVGSDKNVRIFDIKNFDVGGTIEYWTPDDTYAEPTHVEFAYRLDTDLYDMMKSKTSAQSLEISHNGRYFATMGRDRKIRIFNYLSGRLHRVYDESFAVLNAVQKAEDEAYHVDSTDFGRRMAMERDIETAYDNALASLPKSILPPPPSVIFDETDNFVIYPTLIGIKVVNMVTNKVVRVLGKIESSTRFVGLALYQGKNEGDVFLGTKKRDATPDPTIFALAYKKQRFYMFTRREPEDNDNPDLGRDVFNEKITKDEAMMMHHASRQQYRNAIIHTTKGDIHCMLFPDECPKTVENFTTHSKNGYYDGIIFHRVIKSFMIQTGDPLGDGTGGTSIWNKDFEDEFTRALRHDRPFCLSMANAGPGTNGSQFFITTVPVPRLDNKHTMFGRVYKGMDVVLEIEKARTDREDKPLDDISIVNIKITPDVPDEFKPKKKDK
eukprot:gene18254-21844_t